MFNKLTKKVYIENGLMAVSKKTLNRTIKTHWHDFFEIEFILSGGGKYVVDGNSYDIEPNMIFFATPVNFHAIYAADTVLLNIMFDGNMCSSSFLSKLIDTPNGIAVKASDEDANFYKTLIGELIKSQNDISFCKSVMNCIIAKLARESGRGANKKISASQKASLYILENFRQRLTLDDVAAYVGLAPTYFSRVFSEEIGVSFKEYLNSLRLGHAQNLISFSDMTISEVCSESGFNDYANFIRRFKERYGVSPGRYRK